jgi:hypothetical protein
MGNKIQNEKCVNNYLDFINSKDFNSLKNNSNDCLKYIDKIFNKYFISNSNKESVTVILNKTESEYINFKKKYYIHEYNINKIIDKIEVLNINLDNFNKMFDKNIYNNCCNSISIQIYVKDINNPYTLSNYLPKILFSLKNMNKYLNKWIMKLYLDRTVFENIYYVCLSNNKIGLEYIQLLKKISAYDEIEIILYIENEHFSNSNMDRLRIIRFNGFIDKSCNINISHDADSIVSIFDCHNFKIFEKNDFILFTYDLLNSHYNILNNENNNITIKTNILVDSYLDLNINNLLKKSKYIINQASSHTSKFKLYFSLLEHQTKKNNLKLYYEIFTPLIVLCACKFGLKCKFKKEYYDNNINKYKEFIDNYKISKYYNYEDEQNLERGFDENLLILLFSPLLDVKYKIIDENNYMLFDCYKIYQLIGIPLNNENSIKLNYNNSYDLTDILYTHNINNDILEELHNELHTNNIILYNYKYTHIKDLKLFLNGIEYKNRIIEYNVEDKQMIMLYLKLFLFEKNNYYENYDNLFKNKFIYIKNYYIFYNLYLEFFNDTNNLGKYNFFLNYYDIELNINKNKKYSIKKIIIFTVLCFIILYLIYKKIEQ